MKQIVIKLGKKEYKKTNPVLKDWQNLLNYMEQYKGASPMANEEAGLATMRMVEQWFDTPEVTLERMLEELDLYTIMEAYRGIESNLFEVFTGTPLRREKAEDKAQEQPS